MSSRVLGMSPFLNIATADGDTGLSKDTLRVWERRYGFPAPLRDRAGERLYPPEQIERLRLLKRLVDAGEQPGRMMELSMAELDGALEGPPCRRGRRGTAWSRRVSGAPAVT